MQEFLPFIVIGLTTGAVYGLAGTGLVLTYKTSGIFNFAYGSVAAIGVFAFYFLWVDQHWPWPLAIALAVLVVGPALGLLLELLARTLADASPVLQVAATVGIVVAVLGLGDLWYGSITTPVPQYLPTSTIRVLGVNVGWDQITVFLVAVAATIGLFAFFRIARLGVAMRGVVDDPRLIAMTGDDPIRIRRLAWVIGTTFACLSGVLLAPNLSLSGLVLTLLVVQAFGAAAVGYFSSIPLTLVGGLTIGIAGAVATKYVITVPWLAGLPASLPFILLFLVLILMPRARLTSRRYVPTLQLANSYYAPIRVRIIVGTITVAAFCCVPTFAGTKLDLFTGALTDVILLLSLGLLIRVSGQVSLCQYAFAAIGGAAMGHFTSGFGFPWLIALLIAGLAAVPIGALIAIPAIRLSGVFLALATLGFGILLEQMFYTTNFMFGATSSGVAVNRPAVNLGPFHPGTDTGFYFVVLIFAVLSAIALVAIMRSRLGRVLSAMSDSPLALETLGTTVNVSRVLVFCISAFMAAIAGALSGGLATYAVGSQYESFSSLTLVALVVILPIGVPWFAVLGGAAMDIFPAYVDLGHISDYLSLMFGVSAALAAVSLSRYRGAPEWVRSVARNIDAALPRREQKAIPAAPVARSIRPGGLEIRGLTVRYGQATAVDDLTMMAPIGRITGLVGPNGAGKTTTFNAACGLVKPTHGAITFSDRDVSRLGPAARAREGIGRTFQRAELFNSLTVQENVTLGREAFLAGANPLTQMRASRRDIAVTRDAALEAIKLTGIGSIVSQRAGELTTGQRRLVELARVLTGPFDLILLDEPSSGLDAAETEQFGSVLSEVVKERGIGILIVEHDMALVTQVCNYVWVLDFGQLVFEGTPAEMLASNTVKAAYLGSESVADVLGDEALRAALEV